MTAPSAGKGAECPLGAPCPHPCPPHPPPLAHPPLCPWHGGIVLWAHPPPQARYALGPLTPAPYALGPLTPVP